MQFAAPAEHYDRFMGRYTPTLAVALADAAGVDVGPECESLDVGCGPGRPDARAGRAARRRNVAAIDPAAQFAEACRGAQPGRRRPRRRRRGAARGEDGQFRRRAVLARHRLHARSRAGACARWRASRGPGGVVAVVHVGHRGRRDDDAAASSGARCARSSRSAEGERRGPARSEGDIARAARAARGSRMSSTGRSRRPRTTRTSTTSGSRSRSRSGRPAQYLQLAAGRPEGGRREACRTVLSIDAPFTLRPGPGAHGASSPAPVPKTNCRLATEACALIMSAMSVLMKPS